MSGRISTRTMYEGISSSIARASARASRLQQGLGDGRAVRTPSDDPVRAHQAMWYREQLRANDQYERNLEGIKSQLSATDTVLGQIQDVLAQVRTLQTSGADDSIGKDGRAALASQIDQTMELLAELGNSRYAGIYLFAGHRTLEAPVVSQRGKDGKIEQVSFNPRGTEGDLIRSAGPEVSLTINVTASDVFGDGAELFARLKDLRSALAANDGDRIRNLGGVLDQQLDRVTEAATTIGSLEGRVEGLQSRIQQDRQSYEEGRSSAEDLDVAKAVVEFQTEQAALQAALASGSRILNMSLLDYVK
jgi:flagellar hook-associated protein 3 FlgL